MARPSGRGFSWRSAPRQCRHYGVSPGAASAGGMARLNRRRGENRAARCRRTPDDSQIAVAGVETSAGLPPIVIVVVGTRTSEVIAVVIIVAIMMMIVASPNPYAARADINCCGKCGCGKDEGSGGNCSKNVSSHSFLLRGISTSLYATA
jgi:hypothetical protein